MHLFFERAQYGKLIIVQILQQECRSLENLIAQEYTIRKYN